MPRRVLIAQKFASLGGAQKSLVHHLELIDRRRFEPRVVVSNEGWLTRELDRLRVPWSLMPFKHWGNLASLPANVLLVRRLRAYIRRHAIDLMHANEHWVGPACQIAASKEGIPAVCQFRTGLEDLTPRRVRKYRYAEFDRVIVVADVLRRSLAPQLEHPDRVAVVRDGVEPFPNRRHQHGSRRIAITIGAIYEVKGQAKVLERALPWLKASRRHYLVFVGGTRKDPAYVEKMKRVVTRHSLGRQVRFLGPREDVPRLLGMADALVAYSTVEGIPRVVMEAMLAGLPVIVSNSAGMEEVVDGEVGRIVDFDDAANPLFAALAEMSANPEKWRAMGRRGAARAAERYSTHAMSKAIQGIYNEILDGR